MTGKSTDKGKSSFPPKNVSVNYYTDPVYSTDAFYGFEDDCEAGTKELPEAVAEAGDEQEAPDEPVESWGWINNVD